MSKYIDAEKLIAEIDKILAKAEKDEKKALYKKDANSHLIAVTKTAICVSIKKIITSLQQEQPEVDLEKELINYYGRVPDDADTISVARHFYELGLNARKEK